MSPAFRRPRSQGPTGAATPPSGRSRPPRLRSRPWRDPRLAGGIALIGAAVALGAWAVDAAAETEEIYVLAQDVAPGADLGADGVLTVVSSHPGTGAYVRAGDLPAGAVATRSLKAGELLPAGAVGPAQEQNLRSILIEVAEGLPAGVRAGDYADLWALPDQSSQSAAAGRADAPQAELIAQNLIIVSIGQKDTGLVSGTTVSVEVLVPIELVGPVLTAVGGQGPLVLVPTGQSS